MNNREIYPVFDHILSRDDKERLLRQRSTAIWFTGLSGSGKTTLGRELELRLNRNGYLTQVLDGDNIRSGINNNLGFSEADAGSNANNVATSVDSARLQ